MSIDVNERDGFTRNCVDHCSLEKGIVTSALSKDLSTYAKCQKDRCEYVTTHPSSKVYPSEGSR